MRMKNTMPEKALAANQNNTKQSTGPRNADAAKQNALGHGIPALVFQSTSEKEEFSPLREDLDRDNEPNSPIESVLLENIAFCMWRMHRAIAWEERKKS